MEIIRGYPLSDYPGKFWIPDNPLSGKHLIRDYPRIIIRTEIPLSVQPCYQHISVIKKDEEYTTADVYNWMYQAARALNYLHDGLIAHLDIKPAKYFTVLFDTTSLLFQFRCG